jgi:hypothetical protein
VEVDAVDRPVMTAGNYVKGRALFAQDHPWYVKTGAFDQKTSLTAEMSTPDICAPFSPRVCCWSAAGYNEPVTCNEVRQTSYNSSGKTCISCKDSDYPNLGGSLYTASEVSLQDCPYFGDKNRIIPGSDGTPEAVYASAVQTTGIPDRPGGFPRIRCQYNLASLGKSCSAAADWNDMLSSLSHTLGADEHISYDTDVMKALCDKTWTDAKGREVSNWTGCPSCQSWANMLKYEDGKTDGACTTNPDSKITSGDCPAHYSDLQMQEWCASRPTNPACKCVLRSQQPDWKAFASLNAANAGCWYRPCAGGMSQSDYLVEYDARHAQVTGCPDICQSVINLYENGTVTMDDIKQTTICADGGGGDTGDNTALIAALGISGTLVALGGAFLLYKYLSRNKKSL